MDEFFVIFRVVRVEVDPLKLDDGVGVHPLWWDFGVKSELLDLYGSELVEVFSGAGVQEHTNLAERTHVVLILEYLHTFYLLIGFSFLVDLAVLVLHLLGTVGHVDHDPFEVVHLRLTDLHHRVGVVFLFLDVAKAAVVQHWVPNTSYVGLRFLAVFQGFFWAFVSCLFEDIDEGWEFGSGCVVALMILLC